MWSREFIQKTIEETIIEVFSSHNFSSSQVSNELVLTRSHLWGYDLTTVPEVRFSPEHLSLGITVLRRYDYIEQVWEDKADLIGLQISSKHTINLNCDKADPSFSNMSYSDGYGSFKFELEEKSFPENIKTIQEFIGNKILPKLSSFNDLSALDKIVNTSFEFNEHIHNLLNHEGLMYRRMALAKFSGNNKYEDLCNYFRSIFDWYTENGKIEGQEFYQNYPIVFDSVYNKLKDINPI